MLYTITPMMKNSQIKSNLSLSQGGATLQLGWIDKGLRLYFHLYAADFPKSSFTWCPLNTLDLGPLGTFWIP